MKGATFWLMKGVPFQIDRLSRLTLEVIRLSRFEEGLCGPVSIVSGKSPGLPLVDPHGAIIVAFGGHAVFSRPLQEFPCQTSVVLGITGMEIGTVSVEVIGEGRNISPCLARRGCLGDR